MSSPFKAYDIRGIYGENLTNDLAYHLGRAFATFLACRKVVIGFDMRPHSVPLVEHLSRGLVDQGVEVINIGLCSTPMCYFANGTLGADGSIMVTASHNTGEWNGFKLCREQAIPLSGDTGIRDLERIIAEHAYAAQPAEPGSVTEHDILPAYRDHLHTFAEISRPLQVAVDYANAMGIVEGEVLEGLFAIDPLFKVLDGTFPNHEANPLKLETYEALQQHVKSGQFDFGIAFDGDADRVGFVDELGNVVSMDIITTIIAEAILQKEKGPVFYDLRSTWAAREVIEENGGTPMMSRVGHAFIKRQMREAEALFAGELSGHYYFRENYYTESSALAVIYIANIVSQSGKTLSHLAAPIRRYFASGEINSEVEDPDAVLERAEARYVGDKVYHLDGLTVEYEDWWFNLRLSNTEPLVRLNLEAKTQDLMMEKRNELLQLIRE